MAPNPSYYTTSAPVASLVQHQEHSFHLYAFQDFDTNECNMVPSQKDRLPNRFGRMNVIEYDVRDAPDSKKAVVARLQGVCTIVNRTGKDDQWHYSSVLVFTDDRFKGSTLSLQGRLRNMAVVGGTGVFEYAQGVCSMKRIADNGPRGVIYEVKIKAMCLTIPKPKVNTKIGPWGNGNGGKLYEIKGVELPQRLRSISIYANNDYIETIAFSFVDQYGQEQPVGPWGGYAGNSKPQVIRFDPSEILKAILGTSGTYNGVTVVTSLQIVTNVNIHGPYGKQITVSNPPIRMPLNSNQSIVGFYGRAAAGVLYQIGAYVISN